jgi:hypothetical protein
MMVVLLLVSAVFMMGISSCDTQEDKDNKAVSMQQSQYAKAQPVPVFNWSLERHLIAQLYQIRNMKAATHSVWRSDRGMIEGDCPSIGFGLPYDTSLTNPLQGVHVSGQGGVAAIEQAEPNGIFASKNTAATWVMCTGAAGIIEPVYVEARVTAYPYPVKVSYGTNRVTKAGKSTVKLRTSK